MPDLATISGLVAPLVTGLGGWFLGGRKRRIDTETSAFDLYERALKAQGRTEELLTQQRIENARVTTALDRCERAREEIGAEVQDLRDQMQRLAAGAASTGRTA